MLAWRGLLRPRTAESGNSAQRLGDLWGETARRPKLPFRDFISEEVSRHMSDLRDDLDAVPSRLARCESRTVTCHNVCNELRTLVEPWLASFDAEVERVFEDRLSEELSSRFSTFLDDEGVNFADFVNALEE